MQLELVGSRQVQPHMATQLLTLCVLERAADLLPEHLSVNTNLHAHQMSNTLSKSFEHPPFPFQFYSFY